MSRFPAVWAGYFTCPEEFPLNTTDAAALDLKLIRAATLLDSDPAAAAGLAGEILIQAPDRADAGLLLAGAHRRLKQPHEGIPVMRALVARNPQHVENQLELGLLLKEAGQAGEALEVLQGALERQPNLAGAWRELSRLFAVQGDWRECDRAYARYAKLVAVDPLLQESGQAIAQRRFVHAEVLLQQYLAKSPTDVEALRQLAQVFNEREDHPEAERLLGECLRLEPGFSRARFDLANILQQQQKPAPALPLLDRLLELDPADYEFRSLRASTLRLLGDTRRAIAVHAQLLAELPDNKNAWLASGHALRADGQFAEAIAAYRKAVEIDPAFGEACFSLANMKTFRFTDGEIDAILGQLARAELGDEARWHFEFALGKAFEDLKDYEKSFTHYARGNAQRRANLVFDSELRSRQVLRSMSVYTREFFAARQGWGIQAVDPIFILGLPRSGSTLLEQILASHSDVEGTRELPDVPGFANELGARKMAVGPDSYPDTVAALTRPQIDAFGARYLEQTRAYRFRGAARFIDKMPNNFVSIGLIHLMLPNARIIDARRHPMACGFAVFKQLFHKGHWFSYDLAEIGRFYRDYVTLMEHFDAVLPGRICRVHYENLVANPESEIRRVLDYCGLPFQETCLHFHENRRVVQTVSSEQVRQPIYKDGVDQWRNFEVWLAPLKDALGDVVQRYPRNP